MFSKLRFWFICFLFSQLPFYISGQTERSNTTLEMQLFDSARSLKNSNPTIALRLIEKGIASAKNSGNNLMQVKLLHLKGNINLNSGNYIAAKENLRQAFNQSKKFKFYHETINVAGSLGLVYEKQGELQNALNLYLSVLSMDELVKDEPDKAIILNSIGNIYFQMGHHVSAKMYFNESKYIFQQFKRENQLASVFTNLGNVFKAQQNFDSASYYYNQAATNFEKAKNSAELAALYSNLGALYTDHQKYTEALSYYNKSLKLYEKLSNTIGKAEVLTNLGVCYHDQKQYKKALAYLLQAEKLAEKANSPNLLADIYYNISSAYEEQGNKSLALTYSQQYADLKDTLFTEKSNRLISEMRQKYEAEKSEKEIKELRTEKALQQSALTVRTQQRNIFFLSVCIVLMVLSFAVFGYQQKLKHNKLAVQQATENNRREIENLLKEQEIKAISAMIEGQEQERQRIAEDLHDRLGSLLSTVKLNFSGLEHKLYNVLNNSDQYKKGISLLDDACSEVRKIAYNMASGILQKYGFITSVEELAKSIECSGKIKMNTYAYDTEIPIDKETEINLYRITQELISNILRHSGATEINFHYSIIDNSINLLIEDNGKGFNPDEKRNGMGISNIQARISKLEGSINFDSVPGRGTTAIITVPIKDFFLQE